MDLPIPDTLETLVSYKHQMARMAHRMRMIEGMACVIPKSELPPSNVVPFPVTKDGIIKRHRKRKVTLTNSQVHSLLAEHDSRYQAGKASGMTSSAFYRRVRALG